MKRIPLFLVLTLIAVWWYTSWYWYTCNIQWACQTSVEQRQVVAENTGVPITPEVVESREWESLSNSWQEEQTWQEVQSLSREDVLVWDAFIPQAPIMDETSEEENSTMVDSSDIDQESQLSSSGSMWLDTASGSLSDDTWFDSEVSSETQSSTDLCVSPLVGPISLSGNNNSEDVIKLETFLIANAYLSSSDGVYGNADFEAVKQLQLDYKEQMLDPWDIDAPTWYVGRTTVATINDISCN